jgi:hypothetical protein
MEAEREGSSPPAGERRRFTGEEHEKLDEILDEVGRRQIPWVKVVERLKAAGFPERTTKSVRNHYMRMRHLSRAPPVPKNYCRFCHQPQRGHVCFGKKEPATTSVITPRGGSVK